MFSKKSIALALALAALPQLAVADTTFSNATTTKRKEPKLTDYLTMDMTTYYYGASVTAMGSPYQPTPDGYDDLASPQIFQTRFRPGYKITDEIKLQPVVEWWYVPVNGGDYFFGNIFINLNHSKLYSNGNFNVFGQARFYFPTTEKSQNDDLILGARAYFDMTYAVPNAKGLTLALEHYLHGDIWGQGVKPKKRLVQYWWGPYVNYDFTPVWSAKVQVDNTVDWVTEGDGVDTGTGHLRVGFNANITDWLAIAPHVYAPISGPFSWSATVFNVEGWAKLF